MGIYGSMWSEEDRLVTHQLHSWTRVARIESTLLLIRKRCRKSLKHGPEAEHGYHSVPETQDFQNIRNLKYNQMFWAETVS